MVARRCGCRHTHEPRPHSCNACVARRQSVGRDDHLRRQQSVGREPVRRQQWQFQRRQSRCRQQPSGRRPLDADQGAGQGRQSAGQGEADAEASGQGQGQAKAEAEAHQAETRPKDAETRLIMLACAAPKHMAHLRVAQFQLLGSTSGGCSIISAPASARSGPSCIHPQVSTDYPAAGLRAHGALWFHSAVGRWSTETAIRRRSGSGAASFLGSTVGRQYIRTCKGTFAALEQQHFIAEQSLIRLVSV